MVLYWALKRVQAEEPLRFGSGKSGWEVLGLPLAEAVSDFL